MYKSLIEMFMTIGGWPTFLCGLIGFGIGASLGADPWKFGVYGIIVGLGIAFVIWLDKKREEKEEQIRYQKLLTGYDYDELQKILDKTKPK